MTATGTAAQEQPGGPAERVAVIDDSLQCFTYGWLSCLPILGLAYLIPALRRFRAASRHRLEWNPARNYLAAGLALSGAGWLISAVASALVFIEAMLSLAGNEMLAGLGLGILLFLVLFGAVPAVVSWVLALNVTCGWWGRNRGSARA